MSRICLYTTMQCNVMCWWCVSILSVLRCIGTCAQTLPNHIAHVFWMAINKIAYLYLYMQMQTNVHFCICTKKEKRKRNSAYGQWVLRHMINRIRMAERRVDGHFANSSEIYDIVQFISCIQLSIWFIQSQQMTFPCTLTKNDKRRASFHYIRVNIKFAESLAFDDK